MTNHALTGRNFSDGDLHTLTGAYAADALPADELAAFDAHLENCATCAQEVRELVATAARLATGAAEPVPSHLRAQVLDQIQTTRQLAPVAQLVDLRDAIVAQDRRRWFSQPFAVAASVLAALVMALAASAYEADQRADRAEHIAALVSDPEALTLTGSGPGDAVAKVVVADGEAVFAVKNLPPVEDNQDYQLWVIGEKGPGSARSAGILDRGTGAQHVISDVDVGETIGVTLERRGGSPTPTGTPLVLMHVSA